MSYKQNVEQRRHRGILTSNDVESFESQGEEIDRQTRYRVRQKTAATILDLSYLYEILPVDDVFELSEDVLTEDPQACQRAMAFLLVTEAYAGRRLSTRSIDEEIEEILERAIVNSEIRDGRFPDVDVDIEVNSTQPDLDEILSRIREGEATEVEVRLARQLARPEEYNEAVTQGYSEE